MQLFAEFKKILRRGLRATLNFRKFKVALSLLRRICCYGKLCATKLTATCSPMIGQFGDIMILASTGIEWL